MKRPEVTATALILLAGAARAQDCLWTRVSPAGPGDRTSPSMVYDITRARVVLFGGVNSGGTLLSDTWEWNGTSWSLRATSGPPARAAAGMAFDSVRNRTVLFAGDSTLYQFPPPQHSDTWEWDGSTWVQRATGPASPSRVAMAFDAARARTVAFSYYTSSNFVTREWDGSNWSTIAIPGPHSPAGQTMVYDSARHRIVLVGRPFGSTSVWEYDGQSWTQRASVGPVPPYRAYGNAAAAFDPLRGKVVMVGGEVAWQQYAPETWEWDTTTGAWAQRTTNLPGSRPGPAFSWDSARGVGVLFGRQQILTGGQVWEYHPTGTSEYSIAQGPSAQVVNLYDPVTFTVNAPGATGYKWYKNSSPLVDGGVISGANSASLSISRCGLSAIGTYTVVVEGACGPAFASAALGVNPAGCYPNCDGSTSSPVITANDFQCFINQFAGKTSYANCDGSTLTPIHTANDFQCYLNSYAKGCE